MESVPLQSGEVLIASQRNKSSGKWDILQGIFLTTILFVFTLTTGTDTDDEPTFSQYIKLIAIAIALPGSAYNLMKNTDWKDSIKHVGATIKYLWLFMLVCCLLLPFSYFPEISLKKFLVTVTGLIALQVNLAYYASKANCGSHGLSGRNKLAAHLLLFLGGLTAFSIFSLVFSREISDPREYATAGLIPPNVLAAGLGIGLLHTALYRSASGALVEGRLSIIARAFIFLAVLPVFFNLAARGAILSVLIAGIGAALILKGRRHMVTACLLGVALVALVSLLWLLGGQELMAILERDDADTLSTLTGRTEIWDAVADDMHGINLLTGFGYAIAFPSLYIPLNYGFISGTHNAYLQALTSGGILGLLLFLAYIGDSFHQALRAFLMNSAGIYFFACCIFVAVNCLSQIPLWYKSNYWFRIFHLCPDL